MALDDIYWLDQIQPAHRSIVGDKAFYLGLLRQRQYPAVPGAVVSTAVLQQFLASVDWHDRMFADLLNTFLYIDANNPRQLQSIAQQIQQAILATPLPDSLLSDLETIAQAWQTSTAIFRPSFSLQPRLDSTISARTTGLLESHLCFTDAKSLAHGLKQTWSELFRARSLFYWQRLGIQLQQVQFAVLVQPIQAATIAGDLQVTSRQIQVRATWGLGHGLMQDGYGDHYGLDLQTGIQIQQINPKQYAYRLATPAPKSALANWLPETDQSCLQLDLLESAQQTQPALNPDQLQQLGQLARQIQAELGMPLHLEWILSAEDQSFQIVQAMPQFGLAKQWVRFGGGVATQPSDPTLDAAASRLTGLAAAPGRAKAAAWVIDQAASDNLSIPAGVVLVASMIAPEQMIRFKQVAGIVTEQGGTTSHAAILARELGIPAVVGVAAATQVLKTGDQIAIDGSQGEVYYGNLPEFAQPPIEQPTIGQPTIGQPTITRIPPSQIASSTCPKPQLFVTLSQIDRLKEGVALPVDGIGLLRSELMLLELFEQQHPQVWLQQNSLETTAEQIANILQPFVAAFWPRPVFYRALDLRSHEFGATPPAATAPHPMLGLRGTYSYQIYPELLQVQLVALKQVQQSFDNVRLLLPFVRTVEEFLFCRQQVEQMGLWQSPHFQLWIMAEVPSVLLLLPDYVKAGVQGIAIGTNDLTQLLLGVDRDHPQMATAFNSYHPAVVQAIRQLVQTAHQYDLPCTICGQQFEQHPDFLHSLLDWQISGISVELAEVEWVHQVMQHFLD